MMFLGFGAIAAIVWYGGSEVIAGRLTLAMITGFLIYGITIAGSLGGLGGLYGQFSAALGGVKRVAASRSSKPSAVIAIKKISVAAFLTMVLAGHQR